MPKNLAAIQSESIQSESAFDPEFVQILESAFEDAWHRIEMSGSRLAKPAYSRVMREVVAKRIIEMARLGIKDQRTLTEDAVCFVAVNYRDDPRDRA
jgi:hypothetical protein